MLPWQRDTQEYDFNKRGAEKKFHAVGKVKMLVMNGAWTGTESDERLNALAPQEEKEQRLKNVYEWTADLPPEFQEFMIWVRRLDFDGIPDYAYYRQLFRNVLEKNIDCIQGKNADGHDYFVNQYPLEDNIFGFTQDASYSLAWDAVDG